VEDQVKNIKDFLISTYIVLGLLFLGVPSAIWYFAMLFYLKVGDLLFTGGDDAAVVPVFKDTVREFFWGKS
jgi:hypothetical protein